MPDSGNLAHHDDVAFFDDELSAGQHSLDRFRGLTRRRQLYRQPLRTAGLNPAVSPVRVSRHDDLSPGKPCESPAMTLRASGRPGRRIAQFPYLSRAEGTCGGDMAAFGRPRVSVLQALAVGFLTCRVDCALHLHPGRGGRGFYTSYPWLSSTTPRCVRPSYCPTNQWAYVSALTAAISALM